MTEPNTSGQGIIHTFRDGSQLTITSVGVDADGRQRYAYALIQTLAAGDDLRSEIGARVDFRQALASWTAQAITAAQDYDIARDHDCDPDHYMTWAYVNSEELVELSRHPEATTGHDDADTSSA